ncbi:hypothetical protein CRG98_018110 [Punica granatum]|uniref:Retrotransposon gag domain-containing protein n=1 Tax=Punica granatum TaxID=22663 RepID=A0A2I0K1D4_PUNGR|nr:hypothetical protein CRG98_018110 [Punica granatum]
MSPRRTVNPRRVAEEDELDRRIEHIIDTRLVVALERRLDVFMDRLAKRIGALMEARHEVNPREAMESPISTRMMREMTRVMTRTGNSMNLRGMIWVFCFCEEVRHVLVEKTTEDNVKYLLFPATLTGSAAEWTQRIGKDVNYLFGMEQKDGELLLVWYNRFFGIVAKVHEVTSCETISAF